MLKGNLYIKLGALGAFVATAISYIVLGIQVLLRDNNTKGIATLSVKTPLE